MKLLSKIIAFIIVAVANLCEIAAAVFVLDKNAACPDKACIAHLAASILVAIAFALFRVEYSEPAGGKEHKIRQFSNPMAVPAFFLAFFMPFFGPLTASILGFVTRPRAENQSQIFKDYVEYVKSINEDIPRFDDSSEEKIIFKLLEIEPVVDVIQAKSKTAVWGSIDNLSHRTDHGAVSLIRDSIRKDDAEIKFLSSIGLDKMEERFQIRISDARAVFQNERSLSSAINYLEISISYLNSELVPLELNQSFVRDLVQKATELIKEFNHEEIIFCYAQILFLSGLVPESLKVVKTLMDEKKIKPGMLLPAAEILFKAGQYHLLLQLLKQLENSDEQSLKLDQADFEVDPEELKEFWLNGAEK
ncbi:MAG: hypothetical protein ACOYXC_06090 [Candidatus Rifleibacteriota bacterium]